MSSEFKVSRIANLPVTELGEGPQWDAHNEALLYVDIPAGVLHRYFPATGRHQALKVCPTQSGTKLSMAVLVEGHPDLLLVSVGRDIGLVDWKTSDPDASETKLVIFASVDCDKEDNCLNDGKCDPQGRLWIGTYGKILESGSATPGQGALYRLSHDLQPTVVLPKVNFSNGLGWSPDASKFYYVDTDDLNIRSFDYDDATGSIDNPQVLFDYRTQGLMEDRPDGLNTDMLGNLYIASFLGSKVIQLSPDGKLLSSIPTPALCPTNVCWGGPDYTTLYVTSSVFGAGGERMQSCPHAGGVYEVTGLPAKGAPHFRAKLAPSVIDEFERRKK